MMNCPDCGALFDARGGCRSVMCCVQKQIETNRVGLAKKIKRLESRRMDLGKTGTARNVARRLHGDVEFDEKMVAVLECDFPSWSQGKDIPFLNPQEYNRIIQELLSERRKLKLDIKRRDIKIESLQAKS